MENEHFVDRYEWRFQLYGHCLQTSGKQICAGEISFKQQGEGEGDSMLSKIL